MNKDLEPYVYKERPTILVSLFIITMGRDKDLNDDEKRQLIKDLAKSTSWEDIAKKINCHIATIKWFLLST